MADFTGVVVRSGDNYRFDNDDGTQGQRLTTASLEEGHFEDHEINLAPYADEFLEVNGQWEHDWILETEIVSHSAQKNSSSSGS